MTELVKQTEWDTPYGYDFDDEELLDFIDAAPTCVIVRNRPNGHPVGYVVGHHVMDGQIYTMSNAFRATYRALQADPRCTAVFDNHTIGSVTVIGRAELIDDQALIGRYFDEKFGKHPLVLQGTMSAEKFKEMAFTPNRRLVHIIPEKISSLDLRKLPKR
jgi:Pyridoxamine 5'-phosphate oxidase